MASTSSSELDHQNIFFNIVKDIKEYSTEDITDLEERKFEIVQLLKTHRAVKLDNYEYGLSHARKENYRLIVKEENDKSKVREYSKKSKQWDCVAASIKHIKCNATILKLKYGILFAPLKHKCEPREYSIVMNVQDLLKQGKTSEASTFLRKRNQLKRNNFNQSLSTSIFNESNATTSEETSDMENDSNLEQSISTQYQPSSSANESAAAESSVKSKVKRELENDDYGIILDEPVVKRSKIEPNSDEIFSFNRPSDFVLKQICKKLSIEYSNEAYKLWSNINFNEIHPFSHNIQTHEIKTQNLFACFSMFFTGNFSKCFYIQDIINTAFCDELTKTGTKSTPEIAKVFTNFTVSDENLEFIATFFSCRIGIYEKNGELKKYGKWDTENNVLTLILAFVDGLYSVVLGL